MVVQVVVQPPELDDELLEVLVDEVLVDDELELDEAGAPQSSG